MYTMLTCPKCHRTYESYVTACDIKTGGCGYEVPQEAPAAPAVEQPANPDEGTGSSG